MKTGASRKRKLWTAQDDEDLRYWHAFKYTDGRIAKKLGCCRRTVLRQREAMGLIAVSHPKGRNMQKTGLSGGGRLCVFARQC